MAQLRKFAMPLAIIAAVVLVYMQNPWLEPAEELRPALTIIFWVLAIVVIVAMFEDRRAPEAQVVEVEGPTFTRYLFSNTRAGLLWLPVRIFLGFSWLSSGWGKFEGEGWLDGGAALRGYWERVVTIPEEGRPPITFEWFRDFLNMLLDNNAESWFAYVIVFGEIGVGIGLLLGVLVGIAAFFGSVMNMSFLLAGTASSNPVMFALAIGLMLAWRVAGYYGVDRWLLPKLGTPWTRKVDITPGG